MTGLGRVQKNALDYWCATHPTPQAIQVAWDQSMGWIWLVGLWAWSVPMAWTGMLDLTVD